MRRSWWLVGLLAGCSGSITGAGAGSDAGPGGGADARPGAADARPAAPDAGPPASPANRGWIGGACSGPGDCPFTGGVCLTDGFPNGMCSAECTGVCPDRGQPGDTITGCVDGRPFGFDQGACVSRCDRAVFPATGCPAGYACLPRNHYLDASGSFEACAPAGASGSCDGEDQIVAVDYPDRGALWIPREAQCGGSFPLVVTMHGINPNRNPVPGLGGGRHIEYLVRSLIDMRLIVPVLLAEPVQLDGAASSTGLYAPQYYEPAAHLDLLRPHLVQRGITLSSLSFIGHSGAGCDPDNGLYLVLKRYAQLIPAYAPALRMWGLEDVCYNSSYHWTAPLAALTGKDTVLFNMWSTQEDPTGFENGVFPDPAPLLPCPSSIYGKCIRHKTQSWCSYRTKRSAGIEHDDNPLFFVREAFPQVFAVDPQVQPCR